MPQPIKLLRASAGSGKTFSLTAHYLTLLFDGIGKYREILAVTFTNKATAEMKSRILNALLDIAKGNETPFKAEVKKNHPHLSDVEIQNKATQIYRQILHDYSRFSVTTIDGFVQQVIRSFSFELSLDSGYKLEMNQQKVKDELIKQLDQQLENDPSLLTWVTSLATERISDGKDWNYRRELGNLANEIFMESYQPFHEAMMLLKDEKVTHFNTLKNSITTGIKTFENGLTSFVIQAKKIVDDSGILPEHLNRKSQSPLVKFQAILAGDFIRIESLSNFIDNPDEWPNKQLKDTSDVDQLYQALNPVLKELVTYFHAGYVLYETQKAINRNTSYLRLMQEMASLLSQYRTDNRVMLISDAQSFLSKISNAEDSDNPSFIWEKTGNRYKNFLFDEFQDTSKMQWSNFLPLVKNAVAEFEGNYPAHLVVGDVKQSIYRWRNGDWRIIHSGIENSFPKGSVETETLSFNRRSAENIINFNNFLYSTLPKILQNQLNETVTTTGNPDLINEWQKENNQIIQKAYEGCSQRIVEGQTCSDGKIEIRFLDKKEEVEEDEESSVAAIYSTKKLITLLESKRYKLSEICILVRKNTEAEQMINCFAGFQKELSNAAGKEFKVISGDALKIESSVIVQLLINTFKLIATRETENSIFICTCARLFYDLNHPQSSEITFDSNDWLKLASLKLCDLTDYLPTDLCKNYHQYKLLPLTELTEKLIIDYNLNSIKSNYIAFLLAFRDQVATFSLGGDKGLQAFLDWWETDGCKKALPASESEDAVRIMTIHKSKGLEFKAVFLPFMNWKLNTTSGFIRKLLWVNAASAGFDHFGTLPVDYTSKLGSTVFAPAYFEEMLLSYMDVLNTLYVATTRAEEYLCLVFPKTIFKNDPKKPTGTNELQNKFYPLFNDEEMPLDFISDENEFTFGEFPTIKETEEKEILGALKLEQYFTIANIAGKFKRSTQTNQNWFNEKQRKGIALHKLFETLSGSNDLEKQLIIQIQAGNILESEKEKARIAVNDIMLQPQIKEWFNTAKKIISEQDMILENGEVERPDKIFIWDDHAVLLDFKFGEEQKKYENQLISYRNNLLAMGFKQVDAYLWYAQNKSLQKV